MKRKNDEKTANTTMTKACQKKYLPKNFQPGPWDVICQRGGENFHYVGNRKFRMVIQQYLDQYKKASTKQEKSVVVSRIMDVIRSKTEKTSGGGFIKKDLLEGRWFEVGDKLARDKVGQALRDGVKNSEEQPLPTSNSHHISYLNVETEEMSSSGHSSFSNVNNSPATRISHGSTSDVDTGMTCNPTITTSGMVLNEAQSVKRRKLGTGDYLSLRLSNRSILGDILYSGQQNECLSHQPCRTRQIFCGEELDMLQQRDQQSQDMSFAQWKEGGEDEVPSFCESFYQNDICQVLPPLNDISTTGTLCSTQEVGDKITKKHDKVISTTFSPVMQHQESIYDLEENVPPLEQCCSSGSIIATNAPQENDDSIHDIRNFSTRHQPSLLFYRSMMIPNSNFGSFPQGNNHIEEHDENLTVILSSEQPCQQIQPFWTESDLEPNPVIYPTEVGQKISIFMGEKRVGVFNRGRTM